MTRITYYLLGFKAYRALVALVDAGLQDAIQEVVVAEDKGVAEDYSEAIRGLCHDKGLKVYSRLEAKRGGVTSSFALAVGWRWLISHKNHKNVIVCHDSLLPKYRGFAPLVSQLINGEKTLGVSAILASKEYDMGPVISQLSVDINYPIKISEAITKILPLYESQAVTVTELVFRQRELRTLEQNETEATYSIWRDDEDFHINWRESSKVIRRFVDAVGYPYSGAYTFLDGERIVIEDAQEVEDVNLEFRHIGKAVFFRNGKPVIICGEGLLMINRAVRFETQEVIEKWPRFRIRLK